LIVRIDGCGIGFRTGGDTPNTCRNQWPVKLDTVIGCPSFMETHIAAPRGTDGEISADERHRMIAEAAYCLDMKRGCARSDTVSDWLESHCVCS